MTVIGTATLPVDMAGANLSQGVQRGLVPDSSRIDSVKGAAVAGVARFVGPAAIASLALAATAAVGAFVASTIKQAGGLEQSIGAIDVVFRDSAAQMHEWAKGASTSVGLAQDEYNNLSTLIGSQLKNAGTPLDQLAGKTNDLVMAGADMASMFGGTTAEAVEALSSALKGERDPIERYGVSLNQARIDAKAAELGFEKVEGALSSQANAAATLALIMEQTGDAQGNFARESTTYEGIMQRLSASWTNVTTTIGAGFLPIAAAAGSILLSMMPAAQRLAEWFASVAPAIASVLDLVRVGDFAGLGALFPALTIGPGQPLVLDLGSPSGIADMFVGLGTAAASAIDSAAAMLPTLLQPALDMYFQAAQFVWGTLVPALFSGGEDAIAQLGVLLPALILPAIDAVVGLAPGLLAIVPALAPMLLSAAAQIIPALLGAVVTVLPALVALVSTIVPQIADTLIGMIPQVAQAALGWFMGLLQGLALAVPPLLDALLSLLPALVTSLLGMLPSVLDSALTLYFGLVTGLLTVLPSLIVSLLEALPQIVSTLLGMLPTLITTAIDLFFALITGLLQMLPQLLTAIIGILPSLVSTLISLVPTLIGAAIQVFAALVTGLLRNIGPLVNAILFDVIPGVLGALAGAVPQMLQAGINLIGGLVHGLWAVAETIAGTLVDMVGAGVDGFLALLGIHSPSRLFAAHGQAIGDALVASLDDALVLALDSAQKVQPPDFEWDDRGSRAALDQLGDNAHSDTFDIHGAADPRATADAIARRREDPSRPTVTLDVGAPV